MRDWLPVWARSVVIVSFIVAARLALAADAPPEAPAKSETTKAEAAPAKAKAKAPSKPVASADPGAKPPKGSKDPKPADKGVPATQKASPKATAAQSPSTRPPAGSAPGTLPRGKTQDETHVLRLRELESRVDELKEQIRRSHARLSLLSETLLSGGLGGARADLIFRNEMSNAFRVRRILVVLDGAVQYKKQDDTDELSSQKEIPVFSGPVPPGDHTLQVVVGLQGHGYGVFSYLKAFKPEVKHTRSFTVEEGKAIKIEITAWEKGSATTPLEQRPALRLTEKITDRREAELDGAE